MKDIMERELSEAIVAHDQLVVFKLKGAEYSVPIHNVREIITLPKITRLPAAEIFFEGVFNSRGSVIPIINLEKLFGIFEYCDCSYERVIIIESKTKKYGILVDGVSEVIKLDDHNTLEPPTESALGYGTYITGIIKTKDGRLIINIDTESLLNNHI